MSPLEKRERAAGWYQQWIEPVTQALYLSDLPLARQQLDAGRRAVATGEISPADAAEKAGLLLDYSAYFISKAASVEQALALCPGLEARLSQAAASPGAEALRQRLLLQFRCSAGRQGYRPLEAAEFQTLYRAVPDEERNDEFWHFASTWAFTHHEAAILEQAYGEYSVNKGPFMADWLWWRVRLMYQLSTGQATAEDVRQLLSFVDLDELLADFKRTFVGPLEAAGLYTPEIAALTQEREAWIASRSREEILRTVAE